MQVSAAPTLDSDAATPPVNSRGKVTVASLIGTAIEFFDFYIYATAAVIVFPHIFFLQGQGGIPLCLKIAQQPIFERYTQ